MITAKIPDFLRPVQSASLIRVGRDNDGGYILSEEVVRQSDMLVGFGVNDDWSFEEQFHELSPVPVHCYDYTISRSIFFGRMLSGIARFMMKPTGRKWSRCKEKAHAFFSYPKFFSGPDRHHYQERIGLARNGQTSIEQVFSRIPDRKRVFLKIDIEGAEYEVFENLTPYLGRISGIAIEFHDLFDCWDKFLAALSVLKSDFVITHIHGNNYGALGPHDIPVAIEMTFENRRIVGNDNQPSTLTYPLPNLDQPCNCEKPDFKFEFVPRNEATRTSVLH